MNYAVFGWYHHQNAGDDRMQHCLTRWLDGHTLAFLPAGRRPPLALLATYDGVLIGGGGLLMSAAGLFRGMAAWVRKVEIPVALVGVSIEREDPKLLAELRSFLDVCCFAWFRDRHSYDLVGPHPRAFVAPDVTWLFPYSVSKAREPRIAVSLGTAQPPDPELRKALAGLPSEFCAWPLYYEAQGDRRVLKESLGLRVDSEEFDLAPARDGASVISSRYHGIQFALQLGKPVFALGQLPKIRHFMQEEGLEECWSEGNGDLRDRLEAWQRQKDRWRSRVLSTRQRLVEEIKEPATEAKRKLVEAAASMPSPRRRLRSRIKVALATVREQFVP